MTREEALELAESAVARKGIKALYQYARALQEKYGEDVMHEELASAMAFIKGRNLSPRQAVAVLHLRLRSV